MLKPNGLFVYTVVALQAGQAVVFDSFTTDDDNGNRLKVGSEGPIAAWYQSGNDTENIVNVIKSETRDSAGRLTGLETLVRNSSPNNAVDGLLYILVTDGENAGL